MRKSALQDMLRSLASSSSSSSCPPVIPMDPQLRQLLKACSEGNGQLCINLIDANPDILLTTTPHKNNCLHIAAILGHNEFANEVLSRAPSLFLGTNNDGETPLIAALMAANISLASDIITAATQYDDLEEGRPLNRMLLMVDTNGENALLHAMRNGFQDFALQLLDIEPQLSEQISISESPMYMAARKGYSRVVEQLLQIRSSADSGPNGESAFHAAVRFSYTDIVKQLLNGRPQLVYCTDSSGSTPLVMAVICNNLEMVKLFLEYDPNLAYIKPHRTGNTPFTFAVRLGFVSIAEEIRRSCPDSVYISNNSGNGALHEAIAEEKPDSVDYLLRTPQLHRLINKSNNIGSLPMHIAADKCEPKLICSLLAHPAHDYTAINSKSQVAFDLVFLKIASWKTLKWNESFTLLTNVIPFGPKDYMTDLAKYQMKSESIKEVKTLTAKYTSNTSLVAALLATISFAAAFTLPGGFSNDPADAGQPLFARKAAFQVFLISDTIAMCSSLSVAFLCILATWEDLDFLLNYRKTTKALMWCAYEAIAVAFATGLFTVIAPNNLWLAILILVFCTILPFISKIIGDWPLLMVRYRLRALQQKQLSETGETGL